MVIIMLGLMGGVMIKDVDRKAMRNTERIDALEICCTREQ